MSSPRRLRKHDFENPKPIYAVWEITLRCDHACAHCGSRAEFARPDELSTEELLDVADQLIRIGTREVTLIGGEAYLRSDVYQLVEHLTKAGIYVAIQTGGLGLTNRRLKKLKEAGLRGIGVSIDGPEDAHDILRSRVGSWQAGMEAIQRASEHGLIVTSNTQINQFTKNRLRETALFLEEAGVRVWRSQITVPMGRAADRPEWLLQPWEILEVIDTLAELKTKVLLKAHEEIKEGKRKSLRSVFNITLGNNVGYFGPHEELLRSYPGVSSRVWGGCQAGRFTLGIESDGLIKGCPSLPTAPYIGGNIRDLTLEQLWNTEELRFVRDRDTSELWGHCKSCYYAEACRAGCSFTTHCFLGRRGNNPLCYYRAAKLKEEGKRERWLHVEKAEGIPYDFGRFTIIEEPWKNNLPERKPLPLAVK
jgi:radical SAM protein with 4Fe4S-binding SPASM domain